MGYRSWVFAIVVGAAACSTPQTARPTIGSEHLADEQRRQDLFVLESRAADYRRIYDIGERLYRANADLCHRTAQLVGVRFENLYDYSRDARHAAQTLWGLSDRPSIAWVAVDSPASEAGLRPRDQLLSIDGRAVRTGRNSSRQAGQALREASEDGTVTLQVQRGSEVLTFNVAPELTCVYQFALLDGDDINAAADGRTIYLNRGMLRFVQTDDELALVLGHELAHNAMRHIEAKQANATMGMLGGALIDVLAAAGGVNTGGAFTDMGGDIGAMMFSQAFESEADYVGLYFTARAEFDISGAENFWRRMAVEHPRGIRFAYTHPNTAQRYLGLAAAREEIALKLARGERLRPNMRGEQASLPDPTTSTPAETDAPVAEPAGASTETQSPPAQEPMAAAPQQ
jgi:hypothetical protein